MKKVSIVFLLSFGLLLGNLFSVASEAFASENIGQASNVDLRTMTFNLRYLNTYDQSPHTWEERRPTIREVIRMERPEIFGTQEGVYQQVMDIDADLPEYDWIGEGREGGTKGEFMAIFYKKERFTPLEYDHYWLSDTPDQVGSISWGNTIPRMVTWIKFLDRKTNQQFYFVNTHFDHQSAEAREKSAELIVKKAKEEFNPELPVILTGDFNTAPNSVPYQILTSEGAFVDLWMSAETRINEELGTFNGFRDPTGGGPNRRIDWILSKGNVTTKTIEILDYRKNGQYPSDHYPVIADVTLHY
ncbi:endonuclease [Marinithermofilum abyssi]|jgi:endonuclease/exonuclease/phosphatase family metal-dependent hydrolase|uniref:Endonuclease n=1 Tax=Marinithermofilum abyssi TaxID=1571185 RepID=A0A8J2VJN1_9BACL|nr:endonuclease/exonuclease/phosphatase family protein [Marinithermofilum abyssi]GGE29218.1 endonuclease [Marinithermofilum abyssi]